jgi:hypothetical protein
MQHGIPLNDVPATSALRFYLFVISVPFATFLDPLVNSFTRQTLSAVKTKYFFMRVLCIETFVHKQAQQIGALA